MERCNNCGAYELVKSTLRRRAYTCQGCSNQLTSCSNCTVGPYCSSCQQKNFQEAKKVYINGVEYYTQLSQIASTLNIPLSGHKSYNLTDAKWSSFFPNQVKDKWKQLKTTQLSPETQQSELFTENKQLTTNLALKDRELKDLQAEIRALHTQLNEKESSSPYQTKISKLENKLELVKSKLGKWSNLINHD